MIGLPLFAEAFSSHVMSRQQAHCRYTHADLASFRRAGVAGIGFEGALAGLVALVVLVTLVAAFVTRPAVLAATGFVGFVGFVGLDGFAAACALFASVFGAVFLGSLALLIVADLTRFASGSETPFAAGLRT